MSSLGSKGSRQCRKVIRMKDVADKIASIRNGFDRRAVSSNADIPFLVSTFTMGTALSVINNVVRREMIKEYFR